ncbi:MAG: hypothetical protein KR126chlam3_01508 [Chlamydiae bacterium]|nr:hypothetical protein [Chlamydiota bacterium]
MITTNGSKKKKKCEKASKKDSEEEKKPFEVASISHGHCHWAWTFLAPL